MSYTLIRSNEETVRKGDAMNDRVSHQTARKGWKPRKVSDRKLAQYIVESMRENPGRTVAYYKASDEINAIVVELLTK